MDTIYSFPAGENGFEMIDLAKLSRDQKAASRFQKFVDGREPATPNSILRQQNHELSTVLNTSKWR